MRNALEAGIDVLQHVGSAGMPRYDAALVNAIAVKGHARRRDGGAPGVSLPGDGRVSRDGSRIRSCKEDFGPQIWSEVQSSFKNFQALSYFSTADQEARWAKGSLGQWIEANVTMGMGTDSGTPMNFHTEALWREIKAHVDTGMSPQRAIGAATRVNAVILGRGKDLGTIEPGKLADIIVVRGDPLFDITALANVEVVVKDGVVYKGGKRQVIPEHLVSERFVRASGPGGQNVNKVATAVELRFDVAQSSLPDDVKARLARLAGRQTLGRRHPADRQPRAPHAGAESSGRAGAARGAPRPRRRAAEAPQEDAASRRGEGTPPRGEEPPRPRQVAARHASAATTRLSGRQHPLDFGRLLPRHLPLDQRHGDQALRG